MFPFISWVAITLSSYCGAHNREASSSSHCATSRSRFSSRFTSVFQVFNSTTVFSPPPHKRHAFSAEYQSVFLYATGYEAFVSSRYRFQRSVTSRPTRQRSCFVLKSSRVRNRPRHWLSRLRFSWFTSFPPGELRCRKGKKGKKRMGGGMYISTFS
jgi:hypothetical protein